MPSDSKGVAGKVAGSVVVVVVETAGEQRRSPVQMAAGEGGQVVDGLETGVVNLLARVTGL